MSQNIIMPYRYATGGIDDDQLKCYWRYDEASGDIINQSVSAVTNGSSADLQITGATYESGSPPLGNSLYFASGDLGTAGTSLSDWNFMHSTDATFTIVTWYKCNSFSSSEMVFYNTNQLTTAKGFAFRTITTTKLVLLAYNGSGAGAQYLASRTSADYVPDTTDWHFYVVTRDQASDTTTFRRDDANEETPANEMSGTPINGDCTSPLIACRKATYTEMWNDGYLSETSIWDKIMSDEDQTTLYNGGAGLAIY